MSELKPFRCYMGINPFKWRERYGRWRKFSMVDGILMSDSMLSNVIKYGLFKETI
jgi:hypothetical protein